MSPLSPNAQASAELQSMAEPDLPYAGITWLDKDELRVLSEDCIALVVI